MRLLLFKNKQNNNKNVELKTTNRKLQLHSYVTEIEYFCFYTRLSNLFCFTALPINNTLILLIESHILIYIKKINTVFIVTVLFIHLIYFIFIYFLLRIIYSFCGSCFMFCVLYVVWFFFLFGLFACFLFILCTKFFLYTIFRTNVMFLLFLINWNVKHTIIIKLYKNFK